MDIVIRVGVLVKLVAILFALGVVVGIVVGLSLAGTVHISASAVVPAAVIRV